MNLLFHSHIIKGGIPSPIFTFNQLIHLYSQQRLLKDAQKLFDEMSERNVFTWNTIIAAHIKNHDLATAESLFISAPWKDVVTYNSILSGYVLHDGYEASALRLFAQMHSGEIGVDEFSVSSMLSLIARMCLPSLGMQLHSYMVKSGNDLSKFSVSSLTDMYSKCGCFKEAFLVFDGRGELEMDSVSKNAMIAACCRESKLQMSLDLFWDKPELNDTISWNTIIAGFEQNGHYKESVELFTTMLENRVRLNEHTFASILGACSGLKSLRLGKEVHARILKDGLCENPYISSGIVDVYSKCHRMDYAELMNRMSGVKNIFSVTSLILGYSNLGEMDKARRLFDSLEEKNSVVWTALFSGYVKCQQCEPIFPLFRSIITKESICLDPAVLVSTFGACAIQASLDPGKQIHGYIIRKGLKVDEKLVSAIIDMYSKCGCITYAHSLFHGVSNKDSVLYNVMIAGYAHNALENKAIDLFNEMIEKGTRPEPVTFIALLSACRHAGFVELGEKYFHSMEKDYGISPEIDHYSCMVDLYGRANMLEKALTFIREIPIQPDAVIWGSFLSACKINGKMELASKAEDELMRIEGNAASRYVQIANLYAAEGKWSEMQRLRKKMKGSEVKRKAGCSWVFFDSGVCIFTSGDTTHPKSDAIYSILNYLTEEINHVILVDRLKVYN